MTVPILYFCEGNILKGMTVKLRITYLIRLLRIPDQNITSISMVLSRIGIINSFLKINFHGEQGNITSGKKKIKIMKYLKNLISLESIPSQVGVFDLCLLK